MSKKGRGRDQLPIHLEDIIHAHQRPPRPELELPVLPNRMDRLLGVLEAMGTWTCEFGAEGRLQYSSPQSLAIIGFTPEECLESDCIEFHPDDIPRIVETGAAVRATGKPASNQARVRHKQGHWVWTETTIIGWYTETDGEFNTFSVTRDITELKAAEAAKQESEARYSAISRTSCDLIVEVDRTGRQTYVGPSSEDLLGYTPAELVAVEPWSLLHPNDVERARTELFANYLVDDDPLSEDHRPQRIEFRLRHRDGRWLWFETLGIAYPRADGELRYLAVSRDITERKHAEQARLEFEANMQRSQRLESLGVLAGGIAHDFNNLLTPILGAAALGLDELDAASPLRTRLHTIQQAATRAAALTNQMLAYAGQQPLRIERLDLSKLVREMQELVASSISGKTSFELNLESGLPAVEGEAAQIGQVIMNLVTNAAESLGDGAGRIAVRTGVVTIDTPPNGVLFADSMEGGEHIYFEVTDAGCGMNAETRARIFEPFFTTKFTGRGLGLAAVAGIVRAHRGGIEVDSELGRGTRIRVLLPAAAVAADSKRLETRPEAWRSTGTVLVIDDDQGVRELAEDVLHRAGMTVLTAGDGHEGLKLFTEHADSIAVVLLDRTMPVLSGADTFEAIRSVRPDARVVLVSGYSEERVTAELAGRHIAGFLKKPFLPETLVARVREAIETPVSP